MLSTATLCVFLFAVHVTHVGSDDNREQAAAIGKHEDEKIPISEHEFPKENVPTRPDYRGEGHWATPDPNSGIDLGFVPIKLYAQVRRSSTVKHLPRSDALASASTAEEIINAPRLREVVSTKKISEVYTEEGYEDSAYDHGGFAKEAEKDEGYDHHEGSKRKGKPGKKETGAPYDDSESEGTQTQLKQVGKEGQKLNNSDSVYPLNTWMRHKVMRNETRLMFVENEGEDGVPMKVMASYSHTVQHPGGNTSESSEYPSTRSALSSLDTVKNSTNSWKQVQKVEPSNIKPQPLELVNGKSGKKEQQQHKRKHQHQQHQQQLHHNQNIQQQLHKHHQHQKQQLHHNQQQKHQNLHHNHQQQQQQQQEQHLQHKQQQIHKQQHQQQQQQIHQQQHRQQQQNQGQHQQIIPFFLLPTEMYQPQGESINSYNQLMEKLYGTAIHEYSPISTGEIYKKEETNPLVKDGQEKAQYRYNSAGLSSNSLSEQQLEGSSVYVQQAQPGFTNANLGFVAKRKHNLLPVLTVTPLDSVYQRKHPSIPLEEIQNAQHEEVLVHDTSNNMTRRIKQLDILTVPDIKEYPSQIQNERHIQPALLQDRQDTAVPGSNKPTPATKYTSKYKEIRKLKKADEQLIPTTLLPIFEDPLSLWAKFIEALTLEQYSPKGKSFRDPRQGAAAPAGTPPHNGPITSSAVSMTHSFSQHAKEQEREAELASDSDSKRNAGELTPMNLQNISQPQFIPLANATDNETLLYTSRSPQTEVLDPVTIKSSINETQNSNSSSLIDLQTEQSEQDYQKAAPEGYINEQEGKVKMSRRRDIIGYGTPQYLSGDEEEIKLQEEEKLLEDEKEKELQTNVNVWKDALQDAEKGIIKTPQVNTRKYPFYKSLPSNTLSLYSPLRYATNPKAIPSKTEGGMEFYESREHVQCPEVSGPQDVVPIRTAPGDWNQKPRPKLPRLRGLGDKIDCLRTKYFGGEPLDNPFFKENTVGLPQTSSSDEVESVIDDDALRFYADIMEHIRNIGDVNNIPTYSMPEPQYAEFKNTAGQTIKYNIKAQTGGNESSNTGVSPLASQYTLDTSSSHNAIKNHAWNNINAGYPSSRENEEIRTIYNKHPTDKYVSPLLPKFRNATNDSQKYNTVVPARTPAVTGILTSSLQGPHSYSEFENAKHANQAYEHTYKPQHQEVILGMVPPPVPKQTYLIIKTAPRMPKIHTTSILSLLPEPPVRVRPRKTLANPYYYRNIQGLVPTSLQFQIRDLVHHEDNELRPANTGQGDQYAEDHSYGSVRENPNADIMVAEETSKPETVSDINSLSVYTENNRTHHRQRRGVKGYDDGNDDDFDNDEHSTKLDNTSRGKNRGLNTRKQIKSDKPKRKSGSAKKQAGRDRNSVDKARRRIDQEDELEYQYDDYDIIPNRKGNKIRKGDNRREDSDRRDDDVLQHSDYVDMEDYDSEERELKFPSSLTTETVLKVVAGKKAQARTSGSDSRRGEPRYHNTEERRKIDGTTPSRISTETKVGESITKENKRSSLKKGGSQRTGKSKSLKLQETKPNTSTKALAPCREKDRDDGCKDYQAEQTPLSLDEHKDDNLSYTEESVIEKTGKAEQDTNRPKYPKKISSKGFKHNEEKEKETDVVVQETSKKNESVNKLKSKHPESVMSADQINRILGGFMSRHSPSYSSRYKADETTVAPDTTESTTVTSSSTSSTTSTSSASNRVDGEPKGSRSKASSTSSASKDFQKARVIPILNTKVVPELVTSTTKSPESGKNRRRISASRSADKIESPSKSSKTSKPKTSRSKQITPIEDKYERQEDRESRREEKPEYVTTRNVSHASKDKANASRRRNVSSRGNVRKQNSQSEAPATTTEANRSRKRIPIRIKSNEQENNDTSSTSNRWRPGRKGRENVLTEQSSSNLLQAGISNSTEDLTVKDEENSTTPVPRRLQAIEHRRVTKEEIFTTTYYPEDELAMEMERQSELDAAELEAADESRETAVQDDNEDEDEEDDIYEPFESYNYESRHLQYPGNRLHHDDNHYADKDWNSKRGYYIHHAPDHPTNNQYYTQTKRKEKKGTQQTEIINDYGQAGNTENHSPKLTSDNLQNADTDDDRDGPSRQTQTAEHSKKIVTKEGVKGFYIQRSSDRAKAPPPNVSKGESEGNSSGKVLTYVVNQNTGIGTWVSGDENDDDDDATDLRKTTDTGDRSKGEAGMNEARWASARGFSKSRNNLRMTTVKPPKEEKAGLENAEKEEQNLEEGTRDITDKKVEANVRNKQTDKFRTNRGKSQKRNYSSDLYSKKHTPEVSPDSTTGDRISKETDKRKVSQSRFHKNPGKFRQKDNTESVEESANGYSNLKQGDIADKAKNLDKAVRDETEGEEGDIIKDRANDKGSDTYELDRASKSGKQVYRGNKSRRYKDRANQFSDTDANIKTSASELRYYEEELPEETENNEHQKEQYKQETNDDQEEEEEQEEEGEDAEDYHEESTAGVFGTILRQTPPRRTDHSKNVKGTEKVEQLFVKDPGQRYYYYADEPEQIPGKDSKDVNTDRTPIRYPNKKLQRKDEYIEE